MPNGNSLQAMQMTACNLRGGESNRWATVDLTSQLRWSLLETASSLVLAAARIETDLKSVRKTRRRCSRVMHKGAIRPETKMTRMGSRGVCWTRIIGTWNGNTRRSTWTWAVSTMGWKR